MLLALLLIAGPFALPLLWFSRRFSAFWKIVLTLVVLALTVVLCWQFWQIWQQFLKAFKNPWVI